MASSKGRDADHSKGRTDTQRTQTAPAHYGERDGIRYAGVHLILDVIGGQGLDDPARVEAALRACIRACKATLLHIHLHRFSPQGISGIALLAESHISVHTWPEAGYGAFDIFLCGNGNPWPAVGILRDAFDAQDVRTSEILRGEGISPHD